MTTLINLESYLECCQYAALCDEDTKKLIPACRENALPLAYLEFYKRHRDREFLPFPAFRFQQPQQLTPRTTELPKSTWGLTLKDGTSEPIFIVREANSLALRSLQSNYLYADVYRYWNYAEQLQAYAQPDRSLVIYDFNSFTPPQILPLTFETHPNAPYPIPIINLSNIQENNFKLAIAYEDVYNKICDKLAEYIFSTFSTKLDLAKLINYLKQINIFQHLQAHSNLETLALTIACDRHFYSCELSVAEIETIIGNNFPCDRLNQIAGENPNYNVVLITPYNNLPNFRNQFLNLILPNPNRSEFAKNWQAKSEKQFPFYGQHLDRISFFVQRQDRNIEISLPRQICYEGENEAVVYAEYEDTNQQQKREFTLTTDTVVLPFTINNKHFLSEQTNAEQVYCIENQFFSETPNLDIKIRFRLKPGLSPKLEVIDPSNRILKSSLVDKVEEKLGFIPFEQIMAFRQEKSQPILARLQNQQDELTKKLINSLEQFAQSLATLKMFDPHKPIKLEVLQEQLEHAKDFGTKIKELMTVNKKDQLLVYIISSQAIEPFNKTIGAYQKVIGSITSLLAIQNKYKDSRQRSPERKVKNLACQVVNNILLILGKSYALTSHLFMDLDYLFEKANVYSAQKYIALPICFQNLARLSYNRQNQKQYFDFFNQHCDYKNQKFYCVEEYVWGYARILLWYLDFKTAAPICNYRQHFINLVQASQNKLNQNEYLRDALFALIYLLSFREIDPEFAKAGSENYKFAKQLCGRLKNQPIRSKKANIDISLNEFFEQLLDGKATAEQTLKMLEID
jgi:hypothetical protein